MSGDVTRLLLVLVAFGVASIVAHVARRVQKPPHPPLTVQPDGDRPGVVLFTSLECPSCRDAFAMLRSKGLSFREITHEIEPQRFEAWNARAVPLIVVLDAGGRVTDTIAGVPSKRRLARALHTAGIDVSP